MEETKPRIYPSRTTAPVVYQNSARKLNWSKFSRTYNRNAEWSQHDVECFRVVLSPVGHNIHVCWYAYRSCPDFGNGLIFCCSIELSMYLESASWPNYQYVHTSTISLSTVIRLLCLILLLYPVVGLLRTGGTLTSGLVEQALLRLFVLSSCQRDTSID